MKRAIIAGIAGQDGSYLAKLLLEKGYRVLGFLKKNDDTSVLAHIMKDIVLEETELVRKEDIVRWTRLFLPDEIYNFAGISFIPESWDDPYRTLQVNTLLVIKNDGGCRTGTTESNTRIAIFDNDGARVT